MMHVGNNLNKIKQNKWEYLVYLTVNAELWRRAWCLTSLKLPNELNSNFMLSFI